MDKKDQKDREKNVTDEDNFSSDEQLNEDELNVSGGALATTGCPKCNQNPCICSNVV